MIERTPTIRALAVACLALTAAACDSDGDPAGVPDGEAPFQMTLSGESFAQATLSRSSLVVGEPLRAVISLDAVESIDVSIGKIEVHQSGGGWIDVGTANVDVDLLDLSADDVVLIDTTLETGVYTGIRLHLTDTPTITLSEEIQVGRAVYAAGTHDLRIPSADQTGLKLNATFEVDEDGQFLDILFDADATVRKVTATGSGMLKISPVLLVRNDDDEDVGDFDDDEVEGDLEFQGFVSTVGTDSFTLANGTVVVIDADTEIDGDIFTLAAVAEAILTGEAVHAEGEGFAGTGANTIVATKVEFEVETDG